MVTTVSPMPALGAPAPPFRLSDTQGKMVSRDDFQDASALLVIFMSNHCPYVQHVKHGLVSLVKEYQPKGVAVVAISSNDINSYPEDSPGKMAIEAQKSGFTFPYLYDKTQEVAKAYRAVCTPDFFLFDKDKKLVYRRRMDDSRPGSDKPVTGAELRAALDAVLKGDKISTDQKPSMGCSIKWK